MSFIQKLIRHSSTYMIGEVVIMLGGLISFPIFARLLTKEEYGVMSLITITLTLLEDTSTIGIRHGVNRFYSVFSGTNDEKDFYTTTIKGSFLFGVCGSILAVLSSKILAACGVVPEGIISIFIVAIYLVIIRLMTKVIGCLFRMRQQTKTYTIFAVLTRYLGMGCSIVLVAVYLYGLKGFFVGLLLGELLTLLFMAITMVREMGLPNGRFSTDILKKMMGFGLPLISAGFAGTLLSLGDRYLIGFYMTATDVAVYSVPYNLCSYITGILITGFEFAYLPLIMDSWQEQGPDVVAGNVQKIIRIYWMLAAPIILGVTALGEQFITVVASSKYAGASYILPYVITGEMLMGLSTPMMIGLILHQQTKIIARYKWYAAVANILANLALIPLLGLLGAAISTLLCFVLFIYFGARTSERYLTVAIPWRHIGCYTASAVVMFLALKGAVVAMPEVSLLILVPAGALIYAVMLLLLDCDTRRMVCTQMHEALHKA